MECRLGKSQKAVKHGTIAESAGHYTSMNELITDFKFGRIRGESIDSTLTAYNNSCAQMRRRLYQNCFESGQEKKQ